jgi:starvation-inducible outer membrane lipoprotein
MLFRRLVAWPRSRPSLSLIVTMALILAGCAASTQVVRNEHVSKDVKSKSYKEVLLIPP